MRTKHYAVSGKLLACIFTSLILSACSSLTSPLAVKTEAKDNDHGNHMHSMPMDHSSMDHSQMDHSQMDHSQMDHSQMDHSQMDHSQMGHDMGGGHDHMMGEDGKWLSAMPMTSLFGGPYQRMNAIGSGTSLMPADSPAYMWHFNLFEDRARCMAHFEAKVSADIQGGPRGVNSFQSQNWAMGSCELDFSNNSALQFRGMFTAEPFTSPAGGFPQLFQTGETYHGREIVDAQHPHNLISELSVSFTQRLADNFAYYLYLGLPGDREEGPTAFMHRLSALENPAVPLCHHCQDAGHITNGVVSAGVDLGHFRLGASAFHGQEPGENRYTITAGALDSYSVRLQYMPTENWVLGTSYGAVHTAEPTQPGKTDRYTVFAQYTKRYDDGYVAASGVFGHNQSAYGTLTGGLLEGTVNFGRNYVYSRAECVSKPGLTDTNIYGRPGLGEDISGTTISALPVVAADGHNSTVCAFTAGYARDVYVSNMVRVGLGMDVTNYLVPHELTGIYGNEPVSFMFNLRIRPGRAF